MEMVGFRKNKLFSVLTAVVALISFLATDCVPAFPYSSQSARNLAPQPHYQRIVKDPLAEDQAVILFLLREMLLSVAVNPGENPLDTNGVQEITVEAGTVRFHFQGTRTRCLAEINGRSYRLQLPDGELSLETMDRLVMERLPDQTGGETAERMIPDVARTAVAGNTDSARSDLFENGRDDDDRTNAAGSGENISWFGVGMTAVALGFVAWISFILPALHLPMALGFVDTAMLMGLFAPISLWLGGMSLSLLRVRHVIISRRGAIDPPRVGGLIQEYRDLMETKQAVDIDDHLWAMRCLEELALEHGQSTPQTIDDDMRESFRDLSDQDLYRIAEVMIHVRGASLLPARTSVPSVEQIVRILAFIRGNYERLAEMRDRGIPASTYRGRIFFIGNALRRLSPLSQVLVLRHEMTHRTVSMLWPLSRIDRYLFDPQSPGRSRLRQVLRPLREAPAYLSMATPALLVGLSYAVLRVCHLDAPVAAKLIGFTAGCFSFTFLGPKQVIIRGTATKAAWATFLSTIAAVGVIVFATLSDSVDVLVATQVFRTAVFVVAVYTGVIRNLIARDADAPVDKARRAAIGALAAGAAGVLIGRQVTAVDETMTKAYRSRISEELERTRVRLRAAHTNRLYGIYRRMSGRKNPQMPLQQEGEKDPDYEFIVGPWSIPAAVNGPMLLQRGYGRASYLNDMSTAAQVVLTLAGEYSPRLSGEERTARVVRLRARLVDQTEVSEVKTTISAALEALVDTSSQEAIGQVSAQTTRDAAAQQGVAAPEQMLDFDTCMQEIRTTAEEYLGETIDIPAFQALVLAKMSASIETIGYNALAEDEPYYGIMQMSLPPLKEEVIYKVFSPAGVRDVTARRRIARERAGRVLGRTAAQLDSDENLRGYLLDPNFNVKTGALYMAWLLKSIRTNFPKEPDPATGYPGMPDHDLMRFAIAGYNLGYGYIMQILSASKPSGGRWADFDIAFSRAIGDLQTQLARETDPEQSQAVRDKIIKYRFARTYAYRGMRCNQVFTTMQLYREQARLIEEFKQRLAVAQTLDQLQDLSEEIERAGFGTEQSRGGFVRFVTDFFVEGARGIFAPVTAAVSGTAPGAEPAQDATQGESSELSADQMNRMGQAVAQGLKVLQEGDYGILEVHGLREVEVQLQRAFAQEFDLMLPELLIPSRVTDPARDSALSAIDQPLRMSRTFNLQVSLFGYPVAVDTDRDGTIDWTMPADDMLMPAIVGELRKRGMTGKEAEQRVIAVIYDLLERFKERGIRGIILSGSSSYVLKRILDEAVPRVFPDGGVRIYWLSKRLNEELYRLGDGVPLDQMRTRFEQELACSFDEFTARGPFVYLDDAKNTGIKELIFTDSFHLMGVDASFAAVVQKLPRTQADALIGTDDQIVFNYFERLDRTIAASFARLVTAGSPWHDASPATWPDALVEEEVGPQMRQVDELCRRAREYPLGVPAESVPASAGESAELTVPSAPRDLAAFLGRINEERLVPDTATWERIETAIGQVFDLEGEVKDMVMNRFLSPLVDPAAPETVARLFDDGFEAGTFTLGERFGQPSFLIGRDGEPFRAWVNGQVSAELNRMRKAQGTSARMFDFEGIRTSVEQETGLSLGDLVFLMLFLRYPDGQRLMDRVPNQIYQDVFIRMISWIMWHHSYAYPHSDDEYNARVEQIAFAMLPRLREESLRSLYAYSIAAGALGIDMKAAASAASVIDKTAQNIIPYFTGEEETSGARVERMFTVLQERAARPLAIDFWDEFDRQIVHSDGPVRLVWFHDDCAETIFDLYFIQRLLQENPHLRVTSIPRSGRDGQRFGNDASSMDILPYLSRAEFLPLLRMMFEEGRYSYETEGPCWGAIVGQELSSVAAEDVLMSDAIVVKGARSYEMLQGINRDAYFAFMVCREYSETVTGVDADTGLSVFIKQEEGLPSFQGFRMRDQRSLPLFDTGRIGATALMTAAEYAQAVRSPQYQRIVADAGGDQLAAGRWIKQQARLEGTTIAEVILRYDGGITPEGTSESVKTAVRGESTEEGVLGTPAVPMRFPHSMFTGGFEDELIVLRNNVPGLPRAQVTLRACELSQLSDEERPLVAQALRDWWDAHPARGVVHKDFIRKLITAVETGSVADLTGTRVDDGRQVTYTVARVYLALSDQGTNGRDRLDVEGYVAVDEMRSDPLLSLVVNLEVNPADRREPFGLEERALSAEEAPRFVGVNRQLLCYTVAQELQREKRGIVFKVYAEAALAAEGLRRNGIHDREILRRFIAERTRKTFGLLVSAAHSGDAGARSILERFGITVPEAMIAAGENASSVTEGTTADDTRTDDTQRVLPGLFDTDTAGESAEGGGFSPTHVQGVRRLAAKISEMTDQAIMRSDTTEAILGDLERAKGIYLATDAEEAVEALASLPLGRGARLLEAGSGDGRVALAAAVLGYDVTAIEFKPSLIDLSRRIEAAFLSRMGNNPFITPVSWIVGDLFDYDFSGYDAIFYTSHGSHDQGALLRKISQELRPGGYLIVARKVGDPYDLGGLSLYKAVASGRMDSDEGEREILSYIYQKPVTGSALASDNEVSVNGTKSAGESTEHTGWVRSSGPLAWSGDYHRIVEDLITERTRAYEIHRDWAEPAVAVFGSAQIPPEHAYYRMGDELGRELYSRGLPVRTGAGPSMMEAPFIGYRTAWRESDAVLPIPPSFLQGVRIVLPHEVRMNQYMGSVITCTHLITRKLSLCENIIGAVIMPGGFGTLDELFEVWRRDIPFVLIDRAYWEPVMRVLDRVWTDVGLNDRIRHDWMITDSVSEAVSFLESRRNDDFREEFDYNRLTVVNDEIQRLFERLDRFDPAVVFVGRPIPSSSSIEIARQLASRVAALKVSVRVGSRGALFTDVFRTLWTDRREPFFQGLIYHSPAEATLSVAEQRTASLGQNIIVEDILNHQVLLSENALGYVFLPGDVSIFNKLFDILTAMKTGKIPQRPVVLIGSSFWQPVKDAISSAGLSMDPQLFRPADADLLIVVDTVDEALAALQSSDHKFLTARLRRPDDQDDDHVRDGGESQEMAGIVAPTATDIVNGVLSPDFWLGGTDSMTCRTIAPRAELIIRNSARTEELLAALKEREDLRDDDVVLVSFPVGATIRIVAAPLNVFDNQTYDHYPLLFDESDARAHLFDQVISVSPAENRIKFLVLHLDQSIRENGTIMADLSQTQRHILERFFPGYTVWTHADSLYPVLDFARRYQGVLDRTGQDPDGVPYEFSIGGGDGSGEGLDAMVQLGILSSAQAQQLERCAQPGADGIPRALVYEQIGAQWGISDEPGSMDRLLAHLVRTRSAMGAERFDSLLRGMGGLVLQGTVMAQPQTEVVMPASGKEVPDTAGTQGEHTASGQVMVQRLSLIHATHKTVMSSDRDVIGRVLIPEEMIPVSSREAIRERLVRSPASDLRVMPFEDILAFAAAEPDTADVILLNGDLAHDTRLAGTVAQRVVMDNYDFLYLEGGIALCRAIVRKDADAFGRIYETLTGAPLTDPAAVTAAIEEGRVRLELLLPLIEVPANDYEKLREIVNGFLQSA